jgi:serine/threonine-protein kinase
VKGKIGYLSPEQARGQRLDRRSDLYSLGIVMWEMLTLERLYKRDNDFDAMSAIINEPTPPPSRYRHDIPPALDRLVLRTLAKSPDDRFQTAEELGEAIEEVAVQTSSALSSAGLARFLRELFGTRPEPWVAVGERAKGEVVTVTSEPIPAELRVPTHDPVDRRLADVVDLSTVVPGEATSALFATARERPIAIRKRRWTWIAGGGALGVIAAIVIVAVATHGTDVQPSPAQVAAPPAPVLESITPPAPAPAPVPAPVVEPPAPTATPEPMVKPPARSATTRTTTHAVKPATKKSSRPSAEQCATDPMACPR